jgi:hypothetical protein
MDPTPGHAGPRSELPRCVPGMTATITWDMVGCPAYPKPVTTIGFQLKGTVSLITGNGSNAPFETTPPTSTPQVCVTGGNEVPYSNMTMVFGGPATNHFGPQAIHGVVRRPSPGEEWKDPEGRR